jgi:hypothetical protein
MPLLVPRRFSGSTTATLYRNVLGLPRDEVEEMTDAVVIY